MIPTSECGSAESVAAEPGQMPGPNADADPQSGIVASELCGADEMLLAGADSASCAIEDSVGSDAIIMSFFRGHCGGETEMGNARKC